MDARQLSKNLVDELFVAVERAAADYDWPRVLDLSTQILDREDVAPKTAVDALRYRALAHEHMGHIEDAVADLETAVSAAERAALTRHQIKVLNQLAFVKHTYWRNDQDIERSIEAAKTAMLLAQELEEPAFEADSEVKIAVGYFYLGDYSQQREHAQKALTLAQQSGNKLAEAFSYMTLAAYASYQQNQRYDSADLWQKSLLLFRQLGKLTALGWTHLWTGVNSMDLATTRNHYEKALNIARETNHVSLQVYVANNLAFNIWFMGIYLRAEEVAQEAVAMSRLLELPSLNVNLGTLAECYLMLGKYEQVLHLASEKSSIELAEGLDQPGYNLLLSGLAFLGLGNHDKAIKDLQAAVAHANKEVPGFRGTALAWLAAADLAAGDIAAAHQHSSKAISLTETSTLYSPQEVWWWHYQTSCRVAGFERRAAGYVSIGSAGVHKRASLPQELFMILDQACRLMLDYLGNIGDEGLRRNYLNKVLINRDITLEWAKQAAARGQSLEPFTNRETKSTSFEDQFQRLVEIGNRLTAERDPNTLPDNIRNEFVELSGAERAIVALRDEEGELYWASTLGIEEDEREETSVFATPFLDKVREIRSPILHESEGTINEGEVPELQLRSLIALPLISQGKLWGALYGDMRHIFGRFSEQDLSLLNILANHSAAALENANWVQGLEQKVEERTAELQTSNASLEERNAELAIINSIQAGLVAQMEMQGIYDLVGNKIVDFFPEAHSVGIQFIEPKSKLRHQVFVVENGERYFYEPEFYVGASNEAWLDYLIRSKKTFVINENMNAYRQEHGFKVVPGTKPTMSKVIIPMIIANEVRGFVDIQNVEREHAFTNSDVQLLTTITRFC